MRRFKTEPNLKRKIGATIIDYIIYFTVFYVFMFAFGTPNDEGGYTVTGWLFFIPPLMWFIYFPVVESINGQTIGHRLAGIMVITKSGKKVDLGQTVVRRIFDPIDILFFFGLIGILTVSNSERHQRLGDIVAGTLVIGGETVRCPVCHTELTLAPEESFKGRFDCPECGRKSSIF